MVIVDTSLVYKWLIYEEPKEVTESARKLLREFLKGKEKILCPDLLLSELANTLAYKTKLSSSDIDNIWRKFSNINLPLENPTIDFLKKCVDFSIQYHVTVYDASYAVLAKQKNCVLLTADSKFAKKINLPFVRLLIHYPLILKQSLVKNKSFYRKASKNLNN